LQVGRENTTTLIDTLKESLEDLAEAISSDDEHSQTNMAKLVVSILTMMTDGAAVNQSVAREFESFRIKLLPSVVDQWDTFSPDIKTLIESLSLFYCKIHLLVNMADSSDNVLSSYESNAVTGGNPFSFGKGGSGTHMLIRTAAKLLTARGSDKAGVYQHWSAYLCDKDEDDHLVSFCGNRFNIVFFEAAAVYHHRKDIEDFLNKFVDLNLLGKSVLFDTREKVYIGGVRALGIVGKLITSPYERLLTSTNTLLELNPYLLRLQQKTGNLVRECFTSYDWQGTSF
jgi:E1A/CREB-binding protein